MPDVFVFQMDLCHDAYFILRMMKCLYIRVYLKHMITHQLFVWFIKLKEKSMSEF